MLHLNFFSNYVSNIQSNKLLFIVSVAFSLTTNYLICSIKHTEVITRYRNDKLYFYAEKTYTTKDHPPYFQNIPEENMEIEKSSVNNQINMTLIGNGKTEKSTFLEKKNSFFILNKMNDIDLNKNETFKDFLRKIFVTHYNLGNNLLNNNFKLSTKFSCNVCHQVNNNNDDDDDNYKIIINIRPMIFPKKSKIYWKSGANRTFKNNKNDLKISIENNNGNYSSTVKYKNNKYIKINPNFIPVIRNFLDKNVSKIYNNFLNNYFECKEIIDKMSNDNSSETSEEDSSSSFNYNNNSKSYSDDEYSNSSDEYSNSSDDEYNFEENISSYFFTSSSSSE